MFKWIELSRENDRNIWVRIDSIFQITVICGEDGETPDGSMIATRNGTIHFVKELPDEIMVCIHAIEDSKEYMFSNDDIKNYFFDRYPDKKSERLPYGEW